MRSRACALEGLPNKVLAAEYRTALPDEKLLVEELERARKIYASVTFRAETNLTLKATVMHRKAKADVPAKSKKGMKG